MANFIISQADLDPSGQFSGTTDNDAIKVDNINDKVSYTILGLSGQDSILAANGKDTLLGMEGNDTIVGYDGDDIIYGYEGNDSLLGGDNNDIIYGNEGNDFLNGAEGSNTVYGGQGNDIIRASSGTDTIPSLLYGNLGDDSISASGNGSDRWRLFGGQGKDILTGGFGNQTLSGDRGQDILEGGSGEDTLIISKTANVNEIPTGTENADLILDFINGEDKVGLAGVTFEQLVISEVQPPQIDAIFGAGSVENNFKSNITKFLKIESGGELLAVLGRDRDNFTLTASDFIII